MQLDDVFVPGLLVQPVDVLGDEVARVARPLQRGERVVRRARAGRPEGGPADRAPRPVAGARERVAEEGLPGDRLAPLPPPAPVTVVAEARGRAAARPAEHEQGGVRAHEVGEPGVVGIGCRPRVTAADDPLRVPHAADPLEWERRRVAAERVAGGRDGARGRALRHRADAPVARSAPSSVSSGSVSSGSDPERGFSSTPSTSNGMRLGQLASLTEPATS